MNMDKEKALPEFIAMIRKSWTYERMTEAERVACVDTLEDAGRKALRGPAAARWEILHAVYSAFLSGLGYSGPDWREADEDAPRF